MRWKEKAIFAGEDAECTITFKNVAPEAPGADSSVPLTPKHIRSGSRPVNGVIDGTNYSPAKSFNPFSFGNQRRPASTGHRPRTTLERPSRRSVSCQNSPLSFSQSFPPTTSAGGNGNGPASGHGHGHKRSVSILSVGADVTPERKQGPPSYNRPHWNHARSASLQVTPNRDDIYANGCKSRHLCSYFIWDRF